MSLHPQPIPPVPEATAVAARAAFPRGNRYMAMRDELGVFYRDEDFAPLFPRCGQPAAAPWCLALVLVMQFAEGLSDEQAAEAVRGRIDWKYALSLELGDPGFDSSVLSEFRSRLIAGGVEMMLLDKMLECFKAAGLLKSRGRQRTDSTHVLAAVRALNRLACVGETMRLTLNVLAVAAPEWLRPWLAPEWRERYGSRFDNYHLPKTKAKQQVLAERIGEDGRILLKALYQADTPGYLRQLPAVQTLRQVWLEQYYGVDDVESMRWRDTADQPPSKQRIHTPHDVEARYGVKRTTTWTGYKAHLTETCDEDEETPHLITHVVTTEATASDRSVVAEIHAALAAKELLPTEHLLDAGYVDSETLVTSQQEHQVEVLGPVPGDQSWQAAGGGFDVTCFVFDWEAQTVTCPQGITSEKWYQTHDQRGNPITNIRFPARACQPCPARQQCTRSTSGSRHITVRPRAQHEALQEARQRQQTPGFKDRYQDRTGIEGTISQSVRVAGFRRARYVGQAKTHLQHVLTAAAINLRRIGDWFADTPRAKTRTASFVLLMQSATG
jgi:transposase